ncbi:MAG: DUF4215 domain-containing protein [Pseudomonadota bacterium]
MKLHAYPKLLLAVGSLGLSALSSSAAFAFDASALAVERSTPAVASAEGSSAGPAAQKTLLNLMGQRSTSSKQLVCGDSEPDDGEECDDGNLVDGDGCSSTCTIEAGSNCTAAIAGSSVTNDIADGSFEANDGSWTFSGTAFNPLCSPTFCGPDLATDGSNYLWLGGGFLDNGNGGVATQTLVIPATATALTFEWASGSNATLADCESPADDFMEVLIDGVQVFRTPNPCIGQFPYITESIDLAAAGVADGASHTITFQGFNVDNPGDPGTLTNFFVDNVQLLVPVDPPIPPVPSSCLVGVCGDGILSSGEACDDGNSIDGDGCSSSCAIEGVDFVCSDPLYTAADFLPAGAAPTGDAVTEGSLEDARGRQSFAWTETVNSADGLLPICTEVFCSFISINLGSDGIFYALFGASLDPSDTQISQTATIPVGATDLTFDFFVASPADPGPCDSTDDFLEVTVDGNVEYTYDCTTIIDTYETQTVDISAYADGADHEIVIRGVTVATNGQNTNFFVDNISIPTGAAGDPLANASECFLRDTACDTIETFDAGIPGTWTVINLGPDPADGWGTIGDGTCLAQNAAGLVDNTGSENLTSGTGNAACADSDATGQVDEDVAAGSALEMDTYLCSPALDLSTITGPSYSFNTYYQSANNQFNDNGTPDDFADDFDEDLLEVLIGTNAPNALTIGGYTRLGGVNDHEDGNLVLTGAQELSANLEGTELEGQAEGYVCFRYRGTFAWFAQIDNAGLRGEDCALAPVDTDGDGVFDSTDNCTNVSNPGQEDTNGDGIGNRCDADINNDCIVNFVDISQFGPKFNSADGDPAYDPDFDIDSSGAINFVDYITYTSNFGMAPGPSANDCVVGLGN